MTNRYVGGALDLGEVKARAEARAQAESQGVNPDALAAYVHVTEDNLEELLRHSIEVPVIIMIGSARAAGSEEMRALLEAKANAGGLSFLAGYVDADSAPQIAQALGVRGAPTLLAIAAGRPLADLQGVHDEGALSTWLEQIVQAVGPQLQGLPEGTVQAEAQPSQPQPAEDPRVDQALAAVNAGDFEAAAAIYDAVIAEKPANVTEIKQARATIDVLRRLDPLNRTTNALAEAEAAPEDVDKQLDAADAEVVGGAPEAAFERLIALMKTSSGEEKTRVKERLLELFQLFDVSDPRVLNARRNLASALY